MFSKRLQFLIQAFLWLPLHAQVTGKANSRPEIINLGSNREEVKPGKATALVREHGRFSVRSVVLKVKYVKSLNEDDESSYEVTTNLPKSAKAILAWRGIKQINTNRQVKEIRLPPIPPNPDEYLITANKPINAQILTIPGNPTELVVDRLSPDKERITIRCGTKQQIIFDSFPYHSGTWWAVWAGDLDGDGNLDLITEHEGFGEYMQARVVTLWLSSLAGENEILGSAGSRTIFISGD